jgi:hypothetical protein
MLAPVSATYTTPFGATLMPVREAKAALVPTPSAAALRRRCGGEGALPRRAALGEVGVTLPDAASWSWWSSAAGARRRRPPDSGAGPMPSMTQAGEHGRGAAMMLVKTPAVNVAGVYA